MPAMNDVLRLLQFTDPHLFGRTDGELKGVRSYDSLRYVLAHARMHHWHADALLLTGDLVHDDAGGYVHLRELFGNLGKPVYLLPGNHDTPELAAALAGAPFQHNGHADLGNWRVIMLDSTVPGEAHGLLGDAELQRLDSLLASADERHVLICLHHHPVPMASSWLDSVRLHNADRLFTITDRYAGLRAIAWGHVHQTFDARRKGVRLLGTPSTCTQFMPYSETFAVDGRPPGYRRLALHADGAIDTEIVWVEINDDALRSAAG